ncbi:MAG TPA: transglutaminase-like domain-containing protein [Anaerolineales bacterium]|nr:transglutaminase-like domain-containing protein [Anaerolineales bacterium]
MQSDSHPRSFDWISLLILQVMFLVSGLSILTADWADHLSIILAVGALAVAAGAALGYSRFSARVGAIFASVYGAFAIGSQLGGTLDRALTWPDRVDDLIGRIVAAITALFRGGSSLDPLMFVLIIGCIYWVFGVTAGWAVFRRGGLWAAVIPAGVAILINTYFYTGDERLGQALATFVLVSLLLAARLELRRREQGWREKWSQVSTDVAYHVGRAGVIAAFVLVILAWGGPAFAQSRTAADLWVKAARPWSGLKERLGEALRNLRRDSYPVYDTYSDSLTLGAGTSLPHTVVMRVTVARAPNPDARLYWQSHSYDTYTDGQWGSVARETLAFDPGAGDLPLVAYSDREPIEAGFSPVLPALKVLFVPAQTVWISRTVTADVVNVPQGIAEVTRLTAEGVVVAGETYHVRGWVSVPTLEALRGAGKAYPDWVVPQDLSLPPTVTSRTKELAESITQGLDNPFDMAQAVTRWLRENIQYDRQSAAPPADQDPVDWFLFDSRIGFCNYYASAEVLMLRSLGIPARMGVGYASGTALPVGVYEVYADDAHAWPEVFFPGIGWVEFEPTLSQPELIRPLSGEVTRPELSAVQEFEPSGARPDADVPVIVSSQDTILLRVLIWIGLIVLLAGAAFLYLRANPLLVARASALLIVGLKRVGVQPPMILVRAQYASPQSTASQIYAGWTRWLDRLGPQLTSAQTPYERAVIFADRFPVYRDEGWTIAQAYAAERFGNVSADPTPLRRVWRNLLPRLRRTWLRHWLRGSPWLHPGQLRLGGTVDSDELPAAGSGRFEA